MDIGRVERKNPKDSLPYEFYQLDKIKNIESDDRCLRDSLS